MTDVVIKSMKNRSFFRNVMYWLTVYHYTVIYRFSATPAAASSEQSGMVVRLVEFLAVGMFGLPAESPLLDDAEHIVRKLAHFTIYFILGFLLIMMSEGKNKPSFARRTMGVLLCGLLGAACDEWHQYFVPGRSAQLRDVCIDFVGVLTGCTFYGGLRRIFLKNSEVLDYEKMG